MLVFSQPMSQFMRVGPFLAVTLPGAQWDGVWGFARVVRKLDQAA